MRFIFFILLLFIDLGLSANGSYNSFIKQIGYCKQQSYNTTSRSTSGSVSMFLDGRVKFGVGLSRKNMDSYDFFSCGMCINITHIDNFYIFNHELTGWNSPKTDNGSFIVMVFDECKDPVCDWGYLDFDIYNEKQPVMYHNPFNIQWEIIDCPVYQNETIEYILSFQDMIVYYWTIVFRNMRIPIKKVWVKYKDNDYILRLQNSWTWDFDLYDLNDGINLFFQDMNNDIFNDYLNVSYGRSWDNDIIIISKLQN
jgi:hypothetical protein